MSFQFFPISLPHVTHTIGIKWGVHKDRKSAIHAKKVAPNGIVIRIQKWIIGFRRQFNPYIIG